VQPKHRRQLPSLPQRQPAPKGFAAVSREISKLLDSADRTDDEKKDILEKMDAATDVAQLQKILDDLAFPV
jgi:hypothetical protein